MDFRTLADISLQRFRVFVSVVDQQGYSAAASHLGISQPSVSYHVRALERAVGVDLVVYRDRSIHLTPEGEQAYRTAQTILNESARLGDTIERMRGGEVGSLAMGASIAFEHQFFFDRIISPFVSEHPDVHLSLQFAHSIDLADAVLAGALEMAYVNDWQIPRELDFERLHDSELVFLVTPDHPLAEQETITADDINTAGLIASPIESGEAISYHDMLRRSGIGNPRVSMEVDGIQARKLATQSGLGVLATFVPAYAGDHAMEPLRTLRVADNDTRIEFGLVTRAGQPGTPLMEDMAIWLRSVTGP